MMLDDVNHYIRNKINERKEKNAFRTLNEGNDLIDFCSNDYLGLAKSKELAARVEKDVSLLTKNINGSSGARTITGTSKLTLDLENYLASFHQAESALIYNSGYTANLGFFSALPYRGDTIIYDELIHASIRDGIGLSRANSFSFRHNDLNSLQKKLSHAKGRKYVAVESIYSMDGDLSPMSNIVEICKKNNALLVVDEAHSNGLFGEKGEGLVVKLGLQNDVFARVMTFGKAVGCHGAAILGSHDLKDFLINYSRPFIYTTAPSPHQLLAIKNAYDILSLSTYKNNKISKLVDLFKELVHNIDKLLLIESISPIQCVIIPGNNAVKALCSAIQSDGYDVRPIVAPTVPLGKERIRICLHSFNTEDEVRGLVNSFKNNYIKLNVNL